jgi:hypothetical protein
VTEERDLPAANLGIAPPARPGRLVPGGHRETVEWPPEGALVAEDDGRGLVATDLGRHLVASDTGSLLAAPEG